MKVFIINKGVNLYKIGSNTRISIIQNVIIINISVKFRDSFNLK